jgi:ribonuclease J
LAKLARGENWRLPKLQPGDTVIHSARTIPGNEEPVEKMMTMFREDGIEVLMGEEDGKVLHVTGHASRGEMRTMYDWIKPKFAIPVHGGASQLNAHAQLARDCGVQEAILTEEGDVLRVTRRTVQKIAHVNVRHLAIQEGPKETLISWDKAGNQPMKLKQVNSQRKNQSRKEQSQAKPSSRPPRSRRHPRDHAPAIAA